MQKKERKSSFEGYALQYDVLDSFWCNFFPEKIYFDKGSLQLQGEGKNYLSKVFFRFSKLKVTNMAHNELLFVLLVFGTHLTSKNVKESHVSQKKILGLN